MPCLRITLSTRAIGTHYAPRPAEGFTSVCCYLSFGFISPDGNAALKDILEVVECYYTIGRYDLFIKIYARDNEHLLKVIHDRLQPLGLARTETLISLKEGFRRHLPIDFNRKNSKKKKVK